MRRALVVSPIDPDSSLVSKRVEAIAWLRESLGRAGFEVVVISDGETARTRIVDAVGRVGEDDAILVHVSGDLAEDGSLRLDAESTLPLSEVGGALAAQRPACVAYFAELAHGGPHDDALGAADLVGTIRDAFDAKSHGAWALVAVHARDEAADPIAFSRLLFDEADRATASGPAFLSDVYERVRAMPASQGAAQCYALVRGTEEFELAAGTVPAIAQSEAALPALDEGWNEEDDESPRAETEGDEVGGEESHESALADDEHRPESDDDEPGEESRADAEGEESRADAEGEESDGARLRANDGAEDPRPADEGRESADDEHGEPSAMEVRPNIADLVALADGAYARDALDHALAGYHAALALVASDDLAIRAQVLGRVGQIARARGDLDDATRAFERALSIAPDDRAALDGLVDIAHASGEWPRAVALRRKRLETMSDVVERVDELFALARTLVERLRDVPGAIQELTRARALDPARHDVLEALRRANRVLQRWPEVVEVTSALFEVASSEREQAKLRLSQARIAIERLEDDDRGVGYLEAALALDPSLDEARVLLAAIRGEPSTAEMEYARRSSSAIVTREPAHPVDSRVVRADALAAQGEELAAIAELETLAIQTPWDDAAYARLHGLHARAGRNDRAYLAALALEELGATDDSSQATLDLCRPDRALRARASLDEAAWRSLRAPGADEVVEAIFTAVCRPAIAASLEERRSRRQVVALDPARQQSEESTASIVRCFNWASRVLDVSAPDLYVLDQVPGDIAAVPTHPPATAIGPGVLSGLSMKDLAFLTGRHVTYYRAEHQVLVHYPTLNELTVLLLASVQLVSPALPVQPSYVEDVASLRERLVRQITEGERIALGAAVRKLEARGHRVNLAAWIRGVELTACRAGLFLAGDLRSAMGRIRAESRAIAGITADDRRADLLSFCASSLHADLRDRFSVAASAAPERAHGGQMLAAG